MTMTVSDINLQDFALFSDVDENAVRTFLSTGYTFSYKADTPIVVNDDKGDTFFIIIGGMAKIMISSKEFKKPINITLLRTGDFFGELTILENRPARTANVIALSDVEVAALQKNEFLKILNQFPQLGLNLAKVMAQRLRNTNERLIAITMPEPNRIARTLMFMSAQGKSFTGDGQPLLLPALPLHEWSAFCHVERSAFMDVLEQLRQDEVIDWQSQRIVIHNMEKLKELATAEASSSLT